jgi:hypothetical protein
MKRLLLLMAALLACGLIAAGCGGDDDDDSADDSPATTESAPADADSEDDAGAEALEESDSDSDDDDGSTPTGATTEEAVEACKEGVQTSAQQLSAELRADLEDICEESATGDEEDVRKASLEICKKIVEESVPAGPARDQGLETCDQPVPSP